MKQKLLFVYLTLSLLSFKNISAQSSLQPKENLVKRVDSSINDIDRSLNDQYLFLLSKSRNIDGYKLINPLRLTGFWKNISDTLNKHKLDLFKVKEKNIEQEKTINYLKTEVTEKEKSLNISDLKENEIDFLGLSFSKNSYHLTVWAIIFLFGLALIVILIRSSKSIKEAKHKSQLYDEITSELHNFKIKASEKERRLARELQDERNLVEEIKKKIN